MTTQEFIFDTPLYQKVEGEDALRIVEELSVSYNPYSSLIGFDGFNPNQNKESTYVVDYPLQCRRNIGSSSGFGTHSPFQYTEPWYVTLKCCRYGDKIDIVLLLAEDKSIMKIGQYPSIADVHIGQIKDYKGLLSKEELKDFTRSIGLAANGVGVGSFVYLRRIFENLIQSAYEQALNEDAIGDSLKFVKENEMVKICSHKGNVFAVEPPLFVELEIIDTEPGFKGDTAQGATKPATVETGAVVYVPLFVEMGDKLKIDTRTGEYLSRE